MSLSGEPGGGDVRGFGGKFETLQDVVNGFGLHDGRDFLEGSFAVGACLDVKSEDPLKKLCP